MHAAIFVSWILQLLLFNFLIIISFWKTFFLTHDIYPHAQARPTPTTHDPRHLGTLLFSLYVLFSQYRSCDNTLQGVPKVRSSYYMRHNFWSKLHFCMIFLKDVYCFTEYIYSESQYPACPSLSDITLRSRCGMEWDTSCTVESGISFQACLSRLFRSFML